jgi:hypothetical protein
MRKLTRPKSMRETLAENRASETKWAQAFGVPLREDAPMPKEKRVRAASVPSDDTEAPVIKAVGELLAAHPLVLFAVRQNSGAMYYENSQRQQVPVWFYRWARSRVKMRITDYWGLLIGGRMLAIECKKPSWTKPTDDREREQQAFIMTVRANGGAGGFATCVEDAERILREGA